MNAVLISLSYQGESEAGSIVGWERREDYILDTFLGFTLAQSVVHSLSEVASVIRGEGAWWVGLGWAKTDPK